MAFDALPPPIPGTAVALAPRPADHLPAGDRHAPDTHAPDARTRYARTRPSRRDRRADGNGGDDDAEQVRRTRTVGVVIAGLGLALVTAGGLASLDGVRPTDDAAARFPATADATAPTSAATAPDAAGSAPATSAAPTAAAPTAAPTTAEAPAPTEEPAPPPSPAPTAPPAPPAAPPAASVAPVAPVAPPPGWQRFSSEAEGFSVWTPSRMSEADEAARSGARAVFVAPTGSGAHAVVVADAIGDPASLAQRLIGDAAVEDIATEDGRVVLVAIRDDRRVRATLVVVGTQAFLLETTERQQAPRAEAHATFVASFSAG
jgi:hypothetical protein